MKRKIFFRADADQRIGYGHFIRTLALADMLKDDFDCVFYTQTPSDYQKKELSSVCPYVELPNNDSKFEIFLDALSGDEIVVLDNYFFTSEYESLIRQKGCRVVLIDNLHQRHSYADAVLGFLMGLQEVQYSVEPYTRLYLGTDYTLLRRPFLEKLNQEHKAISSYENLSVVVSFGGSDQYGVAVAIANLLATSNKVKIITVIGNHSEGLIQSDKIKFRSELSAQDMCDEFVFNDLAILPASTTMLEALACGIKIIGGYFVDNQLGNYNQYVSSNSIIGCGNLMIGENKQKVMEIVESGELKKLNTASMILPTNLKENILSIFCSLNRLMSYKDNFETEHFTFINYVNLTEEQSRTIWEGRNHSEVRKWMVNTNPFSYEEHVAFIKSLCEKDDRLYWAVASEGQIAGSFSLHPYDAEKKEGEMGKYLLYEFRGKGLGKLATQEFINHIFEAGIVQRVYIKTLLSNTTNQHVNEAAGFRKYDSDDKYVYMELKKKT